MKKSYRRIAFLTAIALVALSLIACGRSFAGKDRSDFILKGLDKKVASLDLNAEQQSYYDKMRSEMKTDLEALQQERRETAQKIKAELKATEPDMKKVSGFMKEGIEEHPKLLSKQIDRLTEFYAHLNSEQQKEVREFIEKRLSRFDS